MVIFTKYKWIIHILIMSLRFNKLNNDKQLNYNSTTYIYGLDSKVYTVLNNT